MRVLVLGGDGFCGWPCALHLSELGHAVTIVDDFSRRRIDTELGVQSLTPIAAMPGRLAAWREVSGHSIDFAEINVATDYDRLRYLVSTLQPAAVVHFAEQRSAPYSMKSAWHKRFTVDNNLNATHNLLAALVETAVDAHVVHLGSIGVYGYAGTRASIPEGYLDIQLGDETAPQAVLYPTDAGSIYHLTKALDQLLFAFYNKNDRQRITDLHQGIVWGTQTAATARDPLLLNRFDYDGIFGAVLNRFVVQAMLGEPLSVHGTGSQSRGFIHIADTVRCVAMALATPPSAGARVRIINQVGEVLRVRDVAAHVARLTGATIAQVENLRAEADDNTFPVATETLAGFGIRPKRLDDTELAAELALARSYATRVDPNAIPSRVRWR
jgi:UDP-sulfoquinovose synthase